MLHRQRCRHIIGCMTFQWSLGRIIYDSCQPNVSNHSILLSQTKFDLKKKKRLDAVISKMQPICVSAFSLSNCGCSQTETRFTVFNVSILVFITRIIKRSWLAGSAAQSPDCVNLPCLLGLTTYFEEPSCTTLASVTSNNRLSVSLLPVGAGLPPPTPCRFHQLS